MIGDICVCIQHCRTIARNGIVWMRKKEKMILEERKYRKPERAFQREVDEAEKTIWMRESAPSHCDCRNNQATEARMSPLSAGIQPGRIRCRIRPVPVCSNLLTFRNRNRMPLGYNETGPILSSSARIAINVTVQIINLSNHSFPQSFS